MNEDNLPRFVMCYCTGECPGFAKMELWKLINYVRNVLDVEYAIVHPQLCVTDGDYFWRDYLREGDDRKFIIGGCDPRMQVKMFRDAFEEKGIDINEQAIMLDLRDMETEVAMKKVEEAVEKVVGE